MEENEDYLNDFCDYMDEISTMHESCPRCGKDYDEVDYKMQLCNSCDWDAIDEIYVKCE